MTKLYKSLFFIILFFISKILSSQSLIGTQSNYAGSNSLSMNPASMTTSDVYFDFSLVNLGLSFYNNYAYIKANDFSAFVFSISFLVIKLATRTKTIITTIGIATTHGFSPTLLRVQPKKV